MICWSKEHISSRCLRAAQAEVLEALRPLYPLADVVLQHRSVHKLLTGFIHTLACFLDRVPRPPSADGKVGPNPAVLLSPCAVSAASTVFRLLATRVGLAFRMRSGSGCPSRLTSFHGPCVTEGMSRAVRCSVTLTPILALTMTVTLTLNSCVARQVQLRRLAGRYNQTGTETGRLCMGEPNFMCMPRPRDITVLMTQQPSCPEATQHRHHQANVRCAYVWLGQIRARVGVGLAACHAAVPQKSRCIAQQKFLRC